jgi:integrase/recombinase XerC
VVESCSPGTGLNKCKAMQQFFRWLVAEGEVERSPMSEVPKSKVVQEIEVLSDEQTRRILVGAHGMPHL